MKDIEEEGYDECSGLKSSLAFIFREIKRKVLYFLHSRLIGGRDRKDKNRIISISPPQQARSGVWSWMSSLNRSRSRGTAQGISRRDSTST
jgi:hypothetical protein